MRSHRGHGLFQRFMNYLDEDFGARIDPAPESAERDSVRIVSAGPNAFVYFVDTEEPLTIEQVDARHPALAERISMLPGIGFILVRGAAGAVCVWRGKRVSLREDAGPFSGRADEALVLQGIQDLMGMRTAGDLVIYGHDAPAGNVSYIPEIGAHAGPSYDELHTFIVGPAAMSLPRPLKHPIQLYDVFAKYQPAA
jgi:hypothetical protein